MMQRRQQLAPTRAGSATSMRRRLATTIVVLAALASVVSTARATDDPRRLPSILLVSIDTLRADHLGVYGYPRATDTRLRSRLRRFDVVENAYTTVPLTVPAHASMMTGRFPRELGVLNNHHRLRSGKRAPPTAAALLAQAGYVTAAVVGSSVLSSVTEIDRGFGVYDEPLRRDGRPRRTAEEVNERAMTLMETSDGPLFLFVHYYDAHPPFEAPSRYGCALRVDDDLRDTLDARGLKGVQYHEVLNREYAEPVRENGRVVTLEEMVARYDASVRHVTDRVSQLLELWDATPHGDGSLVVITSDHGEGLGQHGFWSHGMTLYDEVLRIPMLIRWPDARSAGQRLEQTVSLLDLAPTLLEAAGVPAPPEMRGQSIGAMVKDGAPARVELFAQRMRYLSARRPDGQRNWRPGDGYAVVNGRYKYLESEAAAPALFDLERDPFELRSLFVSRPRLVYSLGEVLEAWREQVPETRPVLTIGENERQRRERLRTLGYVD